MPADEDAADTARTIFAPADDQSPPQPTLVPIVSGVLFVIGLLRRNFDFVEQRLIFFDSLLRELRVARVQLDPHNLRW